MKTLLYRILPLAVMLLAHPAVAQVLTAQKPVVAIRPMPAVPEPTAAAVFALGAALVVGLARSRRAP